MTISLTIFIAYIVIANSAYAFCILKGNPRKAYKTMVIMMVSGSICKFILNDFPNIFMNIENLPYILFAIILHGSFSYYILLRKVINWKKIKE